MRPRPHHQIKPPKPDFKPLGQLLKEAGKRIKTEGTLQVKASQWIGSARVAIPRTFELGEDADRTAIHLLEERLYHLGWAWRWEGDDLVLTLPACEVPAVGLVSIQPCLFEAADLIT